MVISENILAVSSAGAFWLLMGGVIRSTLGDAADIDHAAPRSATTIEARP
jgi:hypothetical protein